MVEVVDNGVGMNPSEFEIYHDIAATTKIRGKGIGFAGVGIKLTLLKAIQRAILRELERMGKAPISQEKIERRLYRLRREIQRIIQDLSFDFPELSELFPKTKRGERVEGVIPDSRGEFIAKQVMGAQSMSDNLGGSGVGEGIEIAPGDSPRLEVDKNPKERGRSHKGRIRRSGIQVAFDEDPEKNIPGWLLGDTIFIGPTLLI